MKRAVSATLPLETSGSRCEHAGLRRGEPPWWRCPLADPACPAGPRLQAVVCSKLIEEFRDALGNRYFQERFDAADLAEIVANVEEAAVKHENPSRVEALLRDPDDDYLVALARQAGAEAIVTGDRDLLDHPGLTPPAIDARGGCELLGLLD